jgi:NAD(P)-dependent dehydrogenase (short-subunit alcohol dehydrogenase family)
MTTTAPGGGHKGVLVTGSSSGIGAAIAEQFAGAGFTVGCISRRGTVPFDAPGLQPIELDVNDTSRAQRVIDDFVGSVDALAGLVNAAGFHVHVAADKLELTQLRSILETNFVSAVSLSQIAFRHLQDGGGFIANIGSLFAKLGAPGSLAYSASKGAIDAVTRTLAVEWAKYGISVVNFAPGYVETGLNSDALADESVRDGIVRRIPVRRIATAEEIAQLVVAVLTTNQGFLTGETITIDGGQGIKL